MFKSQDYAIICFLSYNLIIGCLLFSRGFLLSRQVISDKAQECLQTSSTYRGFPEQYPLSYYKNWCNPEPQFSKVILLLVDALRYDFIERMKFLSGILKQSPQEFHSCPFKFIADPPTTTMQRLKALMTGTMPTFIDAGANFNSYQVEEDNLIYQLHKSGKRIAFLGDDTWLSLFPQDLFVSEFVEAHPSFNAWDLDTVDLAVNATLQKLLEKSKKNESDWDALILHLLGVDHCGHRYGPNHPEMDRKLSESDQIIETIFNSMSNETLLVIFGDHGMTQTGDHGGDSTQEVQAGLVFLSKQSLSKTRNQGYPFYCHSKLEEPQLVSQIDFVPTISTFLGIPIPFSSLGQIIPNFFPNKTYSDGVAGNVAQVAEYIKHYPGIVNSGSLDEVYAALEIAFEEYQMSKTTITRAQLHLASQNYLEAVKQTATSAWTQFDMTSISWGLVIFVLGILAFVIFLCSEDIPTINPLVFTSSLGLVSGILHFGTSRSGLFFVKVFTITGTLGFIVILFLLSPPWKMCSKKFNIKTMCSVVVFSFTCLGVFSNSFIINEGYILGYSLIVIGMIHIVCLPHSSIKSPKDIEFKQKATTNLLRKRNEIRIAWISLVLLLVLIKASQLFFRCREELQECKEEYLLHKQLSSLPEDWFVHKYIRYGIAILSLAIFVVIFRDWTINHKSISSKRPAAIVGKYVPTITVVLTGVLWALEGLPFDIPNIILVKPLLNYCLSAVQGLTVFGILVIWIKPICCVGVTRTHNWEQIKHENELETTAHNNSNLLIKPKPKNLSAHKKHPNQNGVAKPLSSNYYVSRLETIKKKEKSAFACWLQEEFSDRLSEDVYSSSLLVLTVLVTLISTQISSPGMTPVITMIPYTVIAIIGVSGNTVYEGSWNTGVLWTLGSEYFFYATGHHPIFSNIPWDSAFIGGTGQQLANSNNSWIYWIRPALSVIGNVHVSQLIFSISLPLAVYWRSQSELPESLLGTQERRIAYRLAGKVISLQGIKLLCCMLCATIHRRHLMVWKIFGPKFIFMGIGFIFSCSSILISLLFLTKLDYSFQKVLARERSVFHKV